jgi:DNA-binding MarR family transcriptional regulator
MRQDLIKSGSAATLPSKASLIGLESGCTSKRPVPVHPFPLSSSAMLARAEMKARLRRGLFFKESLFSDPAWDILIDLFIAEAEGTRRAVSAVGLTANIPSTTALRWINVLEREGLIEREDDVRDGRRVFISLTDQGISAMTEYFKAR